MTEHPHPLCIVTGAGSGIGRAAAVMLASKGYSLALLGRTVSKLEETAALAWAEAEKLGDAGPTGRAADHFAVEPTDVTDPAHLRAALDRIHDRFERVDALANIAGYAAIEPIESITPASWQQTIETNLGYVVQMTAMAWPWLKQSAARGADAGEAHGAGTITPRGGVIVNVSSMASIDPFPGFATYAAAKVGVNMFTRCTAAEGEPIGVRAVAVAPGAVETPMLRGLFDENAIPADKTLSPDDVAAVIVGCITGERDFKSGETIVVPSG